MANSGGIRATGFFSIAFGSVIGAGWLTVLGFWLATSGPAGSVAAFGAACIFALFVALAYSELAAMFPITGGEVAYTQIAFGSRAAFWSGWMLILLYMVYIAFLMTAASWLFGSLVPSARGILAYSVFGGDVFLYELCFGIAVAFLLAMINVRGTSVSVDVQTGLTLLLVLICAAFIVTGLTKGQPENLHPLFADKQGLELKGLLTATALVLPFYSGFNFVSQAMGERAKSVSASRAAGLMAASVLCAFLFYAGILLSSASLVPREELLSFDLPVAEIFRLTFSVDWLAKLMMVGGLAAIITSWNGAVFAGGRVIATLSQLKLISIPAGADAGPERTRFQGFWLVTIAGMILGLGGRAIAVDVIALGTLSLAVVWSLACLAALSLRLRTSANHSPRPLTVKWGVLVFSLGSLTPVVLLVSLLLDTVSLHVLGGVPLWLLFGVGWMVVGAIVWVGTERSRSRLFDQDRTDFLLRAAES